MSGGNLTLNGGFWAYTGVSGTFGPPTVTKVAAGGSHSLFLKSDGSLCAIGYNSVGALGDGTGFNRSAPVQIVTNNVTAIAAGAEFSLFVKSDRSLWAMGYNAAGQF